MVRQGECLSSYHLRLAVRWRENPLLYAVLATRSWRLCGRALAVLGRDGDRRRSGMLSRMDQEPDRRAQVKLSHISNTSLACAFAKAKVRFVLPFAVKVPTMLLSMTEREAPTADVPGGWLRCISCNAQSKKGQK